MNKTYILGIDQSTTGTKAVVLDQLGQFIGKVSKEHKQYYPKPGWVEHNLEEIYNNTIYLAKEVIAKTSIDINKLAGISITNQRETIALWDLETGKPLYNGLVWQCRRGVSICETLANQGYEKIIEEKTGLKLDTYFSASKIKWAIDNVPEVKDAIKRSTLCIGTIDSWLVFKLTDGKEHVTDYTNASRTMLFNIHELDWDDELLSIFGVKRWMLPKIKSSNDYFGEVKPKKITESAITISGVIGDSQGALFGQQCFVEGMAKATYGTGSSIMMYVGDEKVLSDNGLVTSIAWCIDGQVKYALEGMINSSGDTLKWVKDNLGLYSSHEELDTYVHSISSNEGVYIVPAFVGLGAPYWKQNAKAAIIGLSRKSNKAHIIRAAIESMAYQVDDLIYLIEKDSGKKIKGLNVDGGPSKDSFLMQLQSDLLDVNIYCSKYQELSILGALYLGGLGFGIWKDIEDIKKLRKTARIYTPIQDRENINLCKKQWNEAIQKVLYEVK
ncbi:MAG: glycerol kinase GlpK [Clostridiales bacterium]